MWKKSNFSQRKNGFLRNVKSGFSGHKLSAIQWGPKTTGLGSCAPNPITVAITMSAESPEKIKSAISRMTWANPNTKVQSEGQKTR